jgi:hypothetical protein
MVAFRPDISYAVAKKKAERQYAIISAVGWCVLGIAVWIVLVIMRAVLGLMLGNL